MLRRNAALIWRVGFLSSFAGLNFYFGIPGRGNISYLMLGCLCLVSAVLLLRLSRWSKYPLYAATIIMGTALLGGVYTFTRNPTLLHESLQKQLISWLIPLIPTLLLLSCCTYAYRLSRRV
jgi:hypothetical protein